MTTLKGREILSKLQILAEEHEYNADSKMAGKKYHRALYAGKAFVVSPEVFAEWKSGKIAEFNIVETEREDAENGTTIKGYSYAGSATWDQIKNVVQNESELMVIEKKALASVEISEESLKQLQDSL